MMLRFLSAFVLLLCVSFLSIHARQLETCQNAGLNCTQAVSNNTELSYENGVALACVQIPIFGKTCFSHDTETNLGTFEMSGNRAEFEFVPGDKNMICFDDDVALDWLERIPALAPYLQILKDIQAVLGCLPGGLVSACLEQLGHNCYEVHVELLYFEQWCVLNNVYYIGCNGTSFNQPNHF